MENFEFKNTDSPESKPEEKWPKGFWSNHLRLAVMSMFLLLTPEKQAEALSDEVPPTPKHNLEMVDTKIVEAQRRKSFQDFKSLVETEKINEKIQALKKELGSSFDGLLVSRGINRDLQTLSKLQLQETEKKPNAFVKDSDPNLMTLGSVIDKAFRDRWIPKPPQKGEVVVSGVEKIPGVSADEVKYFLNSHYPSNYVGVLVSGIEYIDSTEVKNTKEGKEVQVLGEAEGHSLLSMAKNTSNDGRKKIRINLPTSGITESSLVDVLTHEINHCSDWSSSPVLTSAERINMLADVLARSQSEDRCRFSYVENIDLSQLEVYFPGGYSKSVEEQKQILNGIKASEYWAEVAKRYFQNSKDLESESPKDFELVKKWVGITVGR